MSANPYDSPDNYDSPFHRITESDLDRQIHALKTRFAAKLRGKIESIDGIKSAEIAHPQLSTCIFISFKCVGYKVRLGYEMDSKQFNEPYTTFDSVDFAINNGKIAGFYDVEEKGKEVRWRVIRVMGYCYDISKEEGFGSRRGGNWIEETNSFQLAENEFQRLLTVSYAGIAKEKEKREAKEKKDKAFMDRILRR